MRLGIILPTSQLYSSIAIDFITGVRMAIADAGLENDIEIHFESLERGANKDKVLSTATNLVIQKQTDVNILFCSYKFLEEISDSLVALQRPFIVTNIGGNPNLCTPKKHLLINSLDLWESAYLAAEWAVGKFGPKTAHTTYFYEAGFDIFNNFSNGLSKAKGEVAFNLVSPFDPDPNDFVGLQNAMKNESIDFLYAQYSGKDAVRFLNNWVNSAENGNQNIVTSGVLMNKEILEQVNGIPKNVHNVISWEPTLDNEKNRDFVKRYEERSENPVNYFSLLGFECAGSICEAMKNEKWSPKGTDQFNSILESRFEGPRGLRDFNNVLQSTQSESFVFTLNEDGGTFCEAHLGVLENKEQYLADQKINFNPSGWFQPYLCQ